MCQQGAMVCTAWYEGEENLSLLEDFFSPITPVQLAKQCELRHRNVIEAGQKARTKPPQLFLLPDTDGNTHLACLGVVLESGAGTSRHIREGVVAGEGGSLGLPTHRAAPSALSRAFTGRMCGSQGLCASCSRKGPHRLISILKCMEKNSPEACQFLTLHSLAFLYIQSPVRKIC